MVQLLEGTTTIRLSSNKIASATAHPAAGPRLHHRHHHPRRAAAPCWWSKRWKKKASMANWNWSAGAWPGSSRAT